MAVVTNGRVENVTEGAGRQQQEPGSGEVRDVVQNCMVGSKRLDVPCVNV